MSRMARARSVPLCPAWGLHVPLSYQRAGYRQISLEEFKRVAIDEPAAWGANYVDVYPSNKESAYPDAEDYQHRLWARYAFKELPDDDQEHRWTVEVVSGRRLELHLEAYRTFSWDDETIVFEHSLDGGLTWLPLDFPAIPTTDRDVGFVAELAPDHSGPILVRAIDTDHVDGLKLDTVAVDELFVRVIP